jgi:hypothetical protein
MAVNTSAFNPIKMDKDGVQAKRVVWSTEALNLALKGLEDGRKLVANPFYENQTKLLKGDLVFQRTEEEINEWKKCATDIIYFVNKYCKLMTPEGIKNVKLRDYQESYLKHLMKNRLSIYLACRQCGKTTTSAVFMLHYILFNVDKNALVLGNKRKTAVEILDKAKKIYQELPYFLRPGIYKWNEGEIVLDNGCRLMAEATTINSGISFTFHCVLADEFAHVQPNIIDKFYNNLFPTITAAKARFMITSTQNGYNLFYRLCKASEARENEYAFFKTDWYEVPEWNPEKLCWEKRDEAWHRLQVANYGSEEAFNKQFGTNFDVNTNTLIDTIILRKFEQRGFEFIRKEIPGVSHADKFFWHPHFDINEMRNNFYAITTDIAEGIGGDDTIFTFNQLFYDEKKEMVCTKTVGYFKANTLNSKEATTVLKEFCQQYLDINKYVISLEYNLYGELFAKYILENIENDPANAFRFNEDVILKYWNEEMTRYTLGKKISAKSKQLGTGMFKQAFEREEIVNESLQFLNQVSNFTDSKGNGTYAACFGHDDLVMAQLQMVFVIENPRYKELCEMFMSANSVEEKMEGYDPYSQMSMDYNNMNSWFQNGYSQEVTDFMDMYNFNM